ncbi:uncharacterized protein LOC116773097 [Danaus plexippus]|uniref:uncharacterized protein LOC116773097 n=1 Tax=Danaus plexippus TaxID=13037 RepID=UPI002AB12D5C|nr:uncharacterized protein LOC116773097 [Danaus plexippus]
MADETANISAKTWTRNIEGISKIGYSDGVVDGQAASFQSSFDIGYSQAFSFGFELGKKKALQQHKEEEPQPNEFRDPRNINCQICLSRTTTDNVVNLFNKQKESNDIHLNKK